MNKIFPSDSNTKARIERAIESQLHVSLEDLAGRSKKRKLSYARALYCYFLRKRTSITLVAIGQSINRDYSSVIFAVNNIKELADVYPKVRDDIRAIDEMVRFVGIAVG